MLEIKASQNFLIINAFRLHNGAEAEDTMGPNEPLKTTPKPLETPEILLRTPCFPEGPLNPLITSEDPWKTSAKPLETPWAPMNP